MSGGAPWTHRVAAASYSNDWRDVAWSETLRLWTAVGRQAEVHTSPDGKTWTQTTLPSVEPDTDPQAVVWMQGASVPRMVIVGEENLIYTSRDGFTYTQGSISSGFDAHGIGWSEGDGVLVAVGEDESTGIILISTNGLDWTQKLSPAPEVNAVAMGSSYVAVGGSGQIFLSTDQGDNWVSKTADGGYSSSFRAATWSSELQLYVIGGDSGEIQTSTDGNTWSASTALPKRVRSLAWSPVDGLFFAVGDDASIHTSPDAITWTLGIPDAEPSIGDFRGVAVGRREVVVVGGSAEIQTTEVLKIDPKHAANFRKLLPPGAAWGES